MAKKTNKTSHVMNLLTSAPEQENSSPEGSGNGEGEAPGKSPVVSESAAPKVTVVDEKSQNDKLSQEILDQLMKEAKEEEQQAAKEEKPKEESPKESSRSMSQEEIQALLAQNAEEEKPKEESPRESSRSMSQEEIQALLAQNAAEEEAEEELPQTAAETAVPAENAEPEYTYINVMEQLVKRQDIKHHMELYGECLCKRCQADVAALILTHLPAKYVIIDENSVAPILNYYENKHKVRILTEIIKACTTVKENPRHDEHLSQFHDK